MFQATSTPDGGMGYWKAIIAEKVRQKEEKKAAKMASHRAHGHPTVKPSGAPHALSTGKFGSFHFRAGTPSLCGRIQTVKTESLYLLP